jgi:hypothetical protein
MLHRKIIVFCSEVCVKHVSKAELYYRLSLPGSKHTPNRILKINQVMLYEKKSRFIPRSMQNT